MFPKMFFNAFGLSYEKIITSVTYRQKLNLLYLKSGKFIVAVYKILASRKRGKKVLQKETQLFSLKTNKSFYTDARVAVICATTSLCTVGSPSKTPRYRQGFIEAYAQALLENGNKNCTAQ